MPGLKPTLVSTIPSPSYREQPSVSSYPTLSVEAARRAFEEHLAEKPIESIVQEATVQSQRTRIRRSRISRPIQRSHGSWLTGFEKPGYAFERQAASLVHRHLGLHPIVAGDAGFWRWLTFSGDGDLADLVDWRYPGKKPDMRESSILGSDR